MKNSVNVFLFFFITGLLVYSNSLNHGFLLDDYAFLNNPLYSNIKFMACQWNPFQPQAMGVYRPLANMLYDFSYTFFKEHFWYYHFLNLLLFTMASFFVYLFITKLTANEHLAVLTGLLYLLHPINGIIVNYISASVFALQVIFMLGSLLLLLKYLDQKNGKFLYLLSLLLAGLSLFWHESAIMLPFFILATVFLFRKSGGIDRGLLCLYFFIILAYFIFRFLCYSPPEANLKEIIWAHIKEPGYLAALFKVYTWYLSKLFYPHGIVMQWGTTIEADHVLLGALGLISLIFIFAVAINSAPNKIIRLALLWMIIGFIPALWASMARSYTCAVIEPHWFVFSSIGFFILAAQFLLFIVRQNQKAGVVMIGLVVIFWAAISHAYNPLWAHQKTYALYWTRQAPELKSTYAYLAYAYQMQGEDAEAEKYYRMVLTGRPTDGLIYYNLGLMAQARGDLREAQADYKSAFQYNPHLDGLQQKLSSFKNDIHALR